MNKKIVGCLIAVAGALLLTATNGFCFGSFGSDVNAICSPVAPYTGDCLLCHASSSKATSTPAKTAYLAGGTTLTNFFCPPTPTCTDNDGDTYAVEGGDCGPVDCDDTNAAINPGATEICTDNIDNNCNGLIDIADPAAVNCDTSNIDGDGDGFTPAQGDCDDTNAAINPNAIEDCTDGIDNNCNNLIDTLDPTAVNCPVTCTDADGDGYSIEGGDCGPVDCNDIIANINPGVMEVCGDNRDNDCDGNIDERCKVTCPDGSVLMVKSITWNKADRKKLTITGRANVGAILTIIDKETKTVLADGIEVTKSNGGWRVVIKHVSRSLKRIIVKSSDGCRLREFVDRSVFR